MPDALPCPTACADLPGWPGEEHHIAGCRNRPPPVSDYPEDSA